MTVASVNSALQRARTTLGSSNLPEARAVVGEADQVLLKRYVEAFEAYDMDRLIALLHEDASISMPPFTMWLKGAEEMRSFYLGHGIGCKGSRMLPVSANGSPAFAHYKPGPVEGQLVPWSIQVLEVSGGRIAHIHHFIGPKYFEYFGQPLVLDV